MDNQPNIVETQTTTPPVSTPPISKPKGNGGLIALCTILGLIIVCLLVYIAYQKGLVQIPFLGKTNTQTNTQTEDTDETNDTAATEEETETNTFTGEAISATLPEGWSLVEYFNGEGSDMLTEGVTYTGLTGLKIFNTDDEEMFWLKGVYGIGFEGCSEYYAFEDDSPTYRQEMQDIADEIGNSMNINDFSSMPYTEYEWLGHTTRRVANRFYQDQTEGNSYFEASCFNILVVLDGVSFNTDGYDHSGYFYEFPEGITGDQLIQIDGILESMSAVE